MMVMHYLKSYKE